MDIFNAVALIVLVWEAWWLNLHLELRPVHGKLLRPPVQWAGAFFPSFIGVQLTSDVV